MSRQNDNEDKDLAAQLFSRSLVINQSLLGLYTSPGDMRYQDTLSLSEAYATIGRDMTDKAVYPEDGAGKTALRVGARSFLNLDQSQSVWGNAQFSTGKYKDIRWSNCIDYHIIAPYVLGDEVGGDLSFRQYIFGGGYSYAMDNGVTLGAALDYRAEIAWRDRDPRIRTIVSDLNLSMGASYRYTSNRLVGVSASIESYTQNCDLEFYNPLNQTNTLPLTGLGSYNKRFSGNTNKNSGHSGLGYRFGLHFGSVDHSGLQFILWFKRIRMNQLLRNFNNITFAYTDTYITRTTIAYPFAFCRSVRMMPVVEGEYFHRLGTENLFGTASGASYDKIGSRSPYLNQHVNVNIALPIEFGLGADEELKAKASSSKTYLTVEPKVGYHSLTEELTSLGRKIEVSTLSPEFDLSLNHLSGNWMYDIRGSYGWTNCIKDKWTFPGFEESSALQESVASTFLTLSSSRSTIGGEFGISRKIGKIMIGLSVRYDHTDYSISNPNRILTSSSSSKDLSNQSNSSSSSSSSSTSVFSPLTYSSDDVERQKSKSISKFHGDNLDISLKINF